MGDRRRVSNGAAHGVSLGEESLGLVQVAALQRKASVEIEGVGEQDAARGMGTRQRRRLDVQRLRGRRIRHGTTDGERDEGVGQVPEIARVTQQIDSLLGIRDNVVELPQPERHGGHRRVRFPGVAPGCVVGMFQRGLESLPPVAEMSTGEPMPVQRRAQPQRGGEVPGLVGPVGRGPQVPLLGREPAGPLGVTRSAERFPLASRDKIGEELRVAPPQRRLFPRGDELVASILPQRLEQAIARFAAGRLHDHEGLIDQCGEQIEDVVGAERLDRIE